MDDRSSKKYPMIVANPATAHLGYLDCDYCVIWQDFTSDWQPYAWCVAQVNEHFSRKEKAA
jgi:hypothetical protein